MDSTQGNIVIVSYGLYLPEAFETAEEVAERSGLSPEEVKTLGIERKCRPAPEDQPIPMAVKAAKQALERAEGTNPEDVDLVLWTGEEYKDYVAQTAAIRLQEEVGCRRAWAFDLVGQGTTTLLGLRLARDMMRGDPAINTVLLAGGTRNVDLVDYRNHDTRWLLPLSASGGALVLRRDSSRPVPGEMVFIVDPEMADEVYVPGGGTEIPFRPDNLGSAVMFYHTPHPEGVRDYLAGRWIEALAQTASQALAGRSPDYLALRHLAPGQRRALLSRLDVSPDRSAPLDPWGCHGTNDVLLSLDLGIKKGAVREGSRVLLLAAGIGLTYAAAVIRWGTAGAKGLA
jgi:3-oxoacyl-[acyl-carrier-protein] synthase-3